MRLGGSREGEEGGVVLPQNYLLCRERKEKAASKLLRGLASTVVIPMSAAVSNYMGRGGKVGYDGCPCVFYYL
jgi:hypothetical protein